MSGSDKKDRRLENAAWWRKLDAGQQAPLTENERLQANAKEDPYYWRSQTKSAFKTWLNNRVPQLPQAILEAILAPGAKGEYSLTIDPSSATLQCIDVVLRTFRIEVLTGTPALSSALKEIARRCEEFDANSLAESSFKKKDEILRSSELVFDAEPKSSEGPIENLGLHSEAVNQERALLPDEPEKKWPGRRRGRPTLSEKVALIPFLEEVYGKYLPQAKNALRQYIFEKDSKLYDAIREYERTRELPGHLEMPTRDEQYLARLIEAEAAGFPGMSVRERLHARTRLLEIRAKTRRKKNPD